MSPRIVREEPFWRRVTLTSLWGGVLVLCFVPMVQINWLELQFAVFCFLGIGILTVLLLIAQVFLVKGWPRRLWSLGTVFILMCCALLLLNEGLVGDPRRMFVHAISYPLAVAAALLIVWCPARWKSLVGGLMALMLFAPWVGRWWLESIRMPSSLFFTDNVVVDYPTWFGEGDDAAVATVLLMHYSQAPNGPRGPELLQIIGASNHRIELPQSLWLTSRPWGNKLALGTTIIEDMEDKMPRPTLIRVVDTQGNIQSIEDVPLSYLALGAMLRGWTFASDESPWQLIPIVNSKDRYQHDHAAILARNTLSGEERLVPDFYAPHFALWEDPETVVFVSAILFDAEETDDSAVSSAEQPEAVSPALPGASIRPAKNYRVRLLRVHLPTGETTTLEEARIANLDWILFVYEHDYVVFTSDVRGELGLLGWASGEVRMLADWFANGSLGVFATERGFRMVYERIDLYDGRSFLMVHDGKDVIASFETTDESRITNSFVSPDGAKVLFIRKSASPQYRSSFPQHTLEVWDIDHDHISVLQQTPLILGIVEDMSLKSLFYWTTNPWSPDSRSVLARRFRFRLLPKAEIYTDLLLYHYEDWAEKKWGPRPSRSE